MKKGQKMSDLQKTKISISHLGNKNPNWGKKIPLEIRLKFGAKGEKNGNWRGGITEETKRIRASALYQEWRNQVFKRDNYTCIFCGDNKGGNLEADHILPRKTNPELVFEISNGRTLCKKCHRNTMTWGNKKYILPSEHYETILIPN